jgi:hypothetical protein
MGLTATLVNVTADELVFLINNAAAEGSPPGTAVIITADNLVVASETSTWGRAAAPRLRDVCAAGDVGLGTVAANAWTQAQARDLYIGNGATQAGSALMPRAELDLQPVSGVAGGCLAEVDANVDGTGRPELWITTVAVVGAAILRVRLRSTPGVK